MSFHEHNIAPSDNVKSHTHQELEQYSARLVNVGEVLNKNVPSAGYTRWLLLRNIAIACKADCMFAVISAKLLPPDNTFIGVPGGTGWGAQCFALEFLLAHHNIPNLTTLDIPLWVYDNSDRWHQLICFKGRGFQWRILQEGEQPPPIYEHCVYAGIGSREFGEKQEKVIAKMYSQ